MHESLCTLLSTDMTAMFCATMQAMRDFSLQHPRIQAKLVGLPLFKAGGNDMQVPPQLSGADELLDIPLDEDCLHRLLSNDLAEDSSTKLKARSCVPHFISALHAHLRLTSHSEPRLSFLSIMQPRSKIAYCLHADCTQRLSSTFSMLIVPSDCVQHALYACLT